MNKHDELSVFERRARDLLHYSARNVDGAARSRLAQARTAALTRRESRPGWFSLRYVAPAGAMATALLVTVLVTQLQHTSVNDPSVNALYDLELLADSDAYELSQEADLEFIEWAASMGEHGKAGT